MKAFSCLFAVAALFMVILSVVASPAMSNAERLRRGLSPNAPVVRSPTNPPRSGPSQGSCGAGHQVCCNGLTSVTDPIVGLIAGLLHIDLSGITGAIGVRCSPITVIGGGNGGCQKTAVCCNNVHQNGLLNIGCIAL